MTCQAFAIPTMGQWVKGIARLGETRGHPGTMRDNQGTGEGCEHPSTINQHECFFPAPVLGPG